MIEDGKDHGFEARTFMDLQCPHQGAKNLINAARFLISLSQLSGVSSVAPVAAAVNRKRAMMFAQVSRPRRADHLLCDFWKRFSNKNNVQV